MDTPIYVRALLVLAGLTGVAACLCLVVLMGQLYTSAWVRIGWGAYGLAMAGFFVWAIATALTDA